MTFETIETERLILRKLGEVEYRLIFEVYSDKEIMKILDLKTNEELIHEKEKYKKGYSTFNKSFLTFQIIDKKEDKILGSCGYHTWYLPHSRAEIGYGLSDERSKSKGIMSEALVPIIDYGFRKMNLNRIEAFVAPDNTPSLKLMEKFSFVKEGQLRRHYFKNDDFEDSIVFSLLKEEYRGLK